MTIEHPILFSGDMVRAILDGRKTQTRRPVEQRLQHAEWAERYCNAMGMTGSWSFKRELNKQFREYGKHLACNSIAIDVVRCPFGRIGDTLWVREAWADLSDWCHYNRLYGKGVKAFYRADDPDCPVSRWRPSIHMPRWACRLLLRITDIRVERLHAITNEDVIAEGVCVTNVECYGRWFHPNDCHGIAFGDVWNKAYGKTFPWSSNPWVWAVTFERIK
jgi:hypothetical protein